MIVPRSSNIRERLKQQVERYTLYFTLILRETGKFVGQCTVNVQEPRIGMDSLALHPKLCEAGYRDGGVEIRGGICFQGAGSKEYRCQSLSLHTPYHG